MNLPIGFLGLGLLLPLMAQLSGPQQQRLPVDKLPADWGQQVPFGLPAELSLGVGELPIAALGRVLFFDPILSKDHSVSCASCHIPERAFADNERFSEGVGGKRTIRNTPTLFNRALGTHFMWDGQADSLEAQALLPIENPLEMDLSLGEAIRRLTESDSHRAAFRKAFGQDPSTELLGRAVAAFVRQIWAGGSRVDHFRTGDRDVISAAERGGLWFFESRGGCWRCHSGPNFSDESFHNTGVGAEGDLPQPGREAITGNAADRGRFKTPTLRGIALTAPYMHDGGLATLEEVVGFYRGGGHANLALDPRLKPLEMTDEDVANLVAFLRAL